MKIVKGFEKIEKQFDFFESYVDKIEWSEDLFDLIITINYYWQDENNCKNRDIRLILKNCTYVSFDSPQNKINPSTFERTSAYSYVLYSIQSFLTKKNTDNINVQIGTTELDHKWLNAQCSDIWVEY